MQNSFCDICGSKENFPLYNRDRNNEKVLNVVCKQCGFVYVTNKENDDEIKDTYADGSFSISARGSISPSKEKIRYSDNMAWNRFNTYVSLLVEHNLPKSGRLLEIGCGIGSFIRYMQGFGFEVKGIEPDPGYADFGEEHNFVPILSDFYEDVNFREYQFDLVFSFHVLEHVLSPTSFLIKARKELKEDGLIFIEVPCIERPNDGKLKSFFWKSHIQTFSKNTLSGLLNKIGFEVVDGGYIGNFLWVMAKKLADTDSIQIQYPFDHPEAIITQTKRWNDIYVLKNSPYSLNNFLRKAYLSTSDMLIKFKKRISKNPIYLIKAFIKRIEIKGSYFLRKFKILISKITTANHPVLAHFGVQGAGNAGDIMLLIAIRKLFDDSIIRFRWIIEHVYHYVSPELVKQLNTKTRGLVIGGGGILLPDTNRNNNSGWVWDCPLEELKKIEVPIIGFAIGYNRFRDQEDFLPIFSENISELIRKSIFFGMRNYGSIRKISSYIDESLLEKVTFQPCPTTVLKYIYPRYTRKQPLKPSKRLALNIAFDRRVLRFGKSENEILTQVARAMKWANDQGWEIYLVSHVYNDNHVIPWLMKEQVSFQEISLSSANYRDILNFYKDIDLTIGMRGHGQMIPFGVGNPIISLISHEKMKYFLEDIQHPEWGVDIQDAELFHKLTTKIQHVVDNWQSVLNEIETRQEMLWSITMQNMQLIKEKLN
ncbi:MAG: methyltransferase domain-containing protein [Anaerolineaceae bacterium]|nr:methyltransferase domain-containing protein [Anaerolineaceae bacterium]